jgi:hypothetical protein
VVWKKGESL